jgi:hypothetical protein
MAHKGAAATVLLAILVVGEGSIGRRRWRVNFRRRPYRLHLALKQILAHRNRRVALQQ